MMAQKPGNYNLSNPYPLYNPNPDALPNRNQHSRFGASEDGQHDLNHEKRWMAVQCRERIN